MATALTPTLIFTLVLATILRERFGINDALRGALLIYAVLATMLPSLVLSRTVKFDFRDLPPQASEVQSETSTPPGRPSGTTSHAGLS